MIKTPNYQIKQSHFQKIWQQNVQSMWRNINIDTYTQLLFDIALLMINRLVAESTIKVPFRGQPLFSISKKLLCFQADGHIKIKPVSRDAKDIQIAFNNPPLQCTLSQWHSWLYELTPAHLLQVYHLEYLNGIAEGSSKKIAILHNVEQYHEIKGGLLVVAKNKTIKTITFKEMAEATEINLNIDANTLKSVTEVQASFILKAQPTSERILITRCSKEDLETKPEVETDIFDKIPNTSRYEKSNSLTYLTSLIAIYQDRYAFQQRDKEVEIYDIEESKLVGKFNIEGSIKFADINTNLLLIITNKEQTDYFNFFVLNPEPSVLQPLITNRAVYEKGRGDYYKFINLLSNEANVILDKKKNSDFSEGGISKVSENTSSIVYALNKAKEKVEIIKLDHSKLLKSPFGQEKLDKIVYSKKVAQLQVHSTENIEYERSRIHSSIELKTGEKTMEEMQKKFVENLIDIKLKSVLARFEKLQKKVENLEKLIGSISERVEVNLARINRQEIKLNVEKLFDSLTPQFQRYFAEIFKQVAGVLEQGVGYYNMKLAKEAEMHKEALTQIVTETFKATEDIVQIGRKEQGISERTEEHLKKILDSKKRWTKSTEDYEAKLREVPTPSLKTSPLSGESKAEGKVFVRADLNYPNSKREG